MPLLGLQLRCSNPGDARVNFLYGAIVCRMAYLSIKTIPITKGNNVLAF